MRILLPIWTITFLLALPLLAEPSTQPTTTPDSPSATPASPTAVMHAYLAALDRQDAKAALTFFNTADPAEASVAKLQVDMMLAVNRLKKNIRDKIDPGAPYDLKMAVVGEDECGPITEHITNNTATLEVSSADDQTNISRGPDTYALVRINKHWKLSTADKIKQQADSKVPPDREAAATQHLIAALNRTADAVAAGKFHTTDDIQQAISQSLASP